MESNTRRRCWDKGWQDNGDFTRVWKSALRPDPHFGIINWRFGGYWRVLFSEFPPTELITTFDVFYGTWQHAVDAGDLIPEW